MFAPVYSSEPALNLAPSLSLRCFRPRKSHGSVAVLDDDVDFALVTGSEVNEVGAVVEPGDLAVQFLSTWQAPSTTTTRVSANAASTASCACLATRLDGDYRSIPTNPPREPRGSTTTIPQIHRARAADPPSGRTHDCPPLAHPCRKPSHTSLVSTHPADNSEQHHELSVEELRRHAPGGTWPRR